MNCERAQNELSARMDGEPPGRFTSAVDEHAAGCPSCRAFQAGAARVRTAVRIRPAEQVPNLVEAIMARVAAETRAPRRLRRPPPLARQNRARRLTPVLAATIAGVMAGSVVVGGPWQGPSNRPIAAAALALDVQQAAPSLDAFAGTFAITERGLSTTVPVRHLSMDVSFLAPQRFRMDVHDLTTYPSPSWTPTNLTYISDGSSTYRSGPTGCPATLPAGGCLPTRTTITRASAYSAQAPAPADLVLPLTTFSSADGIDVLGTGQMMGRQAVEVQLTFARAELLLPFLDLGGNWRPFFDQDRVDLWLDRTSWFPLRTSVYPSTDPARRAWELRFGMPVEASTASILDVQLTSFNREPPDPALFTAPGWSGADSMPLAAFPNRVGYLPVTLTSPGNLQLSSAVAPPRDHPNAPRSVLLYTEGMSYVRLGERPNWDGPTLFGPLGEAAELVSLSSGGVAYYEPASDGFGRRLAIHTSGTNLFLESNLPRAQLLHLAASLPIRGQPLPGAWTTVSGSGISIEQAAPAVALARSPVPVVLPTTLPAGYVLVSASISSDRSGPTGVSFVFRQRESDAAGGPIVLHAQMADALPPASSAHQLLVDLAGTSARWTSDREQLEWVRDGVYVSVQGPLDLDAMLQLASQIQVGTGGVAP